MKIYEKKTVTNTYDELVERRCDLCGRNSDRMAWGSAVYVVDETEIIISICQKEGFSYPGDSYGKEYEIDLCPNCFKIKLIPWLCSQGAIIKQEEWGDW